MSLFNNRKANNVNNVQPQGQEYYDNAGTFGNDRTVPRTTHAGTVGAGAGTRNTAVGSDYTTTTGGGLHHPHGRVGGGVQGAGGAMEYGRTPMSGPAPTTAGPHAHDIMNKLDPRVDSTADHQLVQPEPHAHSSKLANVLDPRVDSTVANNQNMGVAGNNHHHATTGAGYGGAYNSTTGATGGRTAGGTGPTLHQASPASGPASRTAGPHSSNLMNKLDPSVDSRTGASSSARGPGQTSTMHGANQPGMTRY